MRRAVIPTDTIFICVTKPVIPISCAWMAEVRFCDRVPLTTISPGAGLIVTAAFLHQTLLAGDSGKLFIAFSGILLLTKSFSG